MDNSVTLTWDGKPYQFTNPEQVIPTLIEEGDLVLVEIAAATNERDGEATSTEFDQENAAGEDEPAGEDPYDE
jgi:hypothetical protein